MKTLFYYVVLSYSKFTDVPKQKADAEISEKININYLKSKYTLKVNKSIHQVKNTKKIY